ncbi:hypothetical protein BH11ACT5_BH11ACT5_19820 [soil metagenome]
MDSRWARVARGVTAASIATFVAAFSHWISGGVAPSWFGVGVSLVISIMVCTVFTGRTLSVWRLAVSIGLSQFLFHSLFSGLGTPVIAEHHMGAMDATAAHLHAAPTMWLAHAIAALVTVVAFRFGEQAFWGVAGTARLLLARLLIVVIPTLDVPRPVVAVERRYLPRDLALLLSSMRHRGPPVELTA